MINLGIVNYRTTQVQKLEWILELVKTNYRDGRCENLPFHQITSDCREPCTAHLAERPAGRVYPLIKVSHLGSLRAHRAH